MIEVIFIDKAETVIISMNDLSIINTFFKNTLNVSSLQTLLIDLMTKHYRFTYQDIEYYHKSANIDNVNGIAKVTYQEV